MRTALGLRLLAANILVGVACSGSAPERDTPPRAPSASPQSADERIERWTRERAGQPLQASIAFHQLESDSAILALLQRHNVRAYLAHAWAGGVNRYAQVPPEQADNSVIASARAQLRQRLERNVCNVPQRVARALGDRAVARDAEGARIARNLLARLRAEEEALAHVRVGGAIIWAVYVSGAPADVRRLAADPLVWSFEPIEFAVEEGQTLVGVPRPPEPRPVGEIPIYPDIEALAPSDVSAQLEQLAVRPAHDCPAPEAANRTISGHWSVAAQRDGRAILIGLRSARRGTRAGRPDQVALDALSYTAGEQFQRVTVQLVPLTLAGVPPERARPLSIGRVRAGARELFVNVPGFAPPLYPSPADPGTYLFAEANALWVFSDPDSVRRLTAERVGVFDYDSLAPRQREGKVILYWADAPLWSPDGRSIVYVTNREAVHQNSRGQSVWLLDTTTGNERALLHENGQSFVAYGWLGRELLFGGPSGVGAIDVSSGARRQLDAGTFVAASPDASVVMVADDVPDATRLRMLSRTGVVPIPPPPAGSTYAAQAAFSPAGRRVLLQATGAAGHERRYMVFDRDTGLITDVKSGAPIVTDWPQWLGEDQLLLNVVDGPTQAPAAIIVDVGG